MHQGLGSLKPSPIMSTDLLHRKVLSIRTIDMALQARATFAGPLQKSEEKQEHFRA